MMTQQYIDVEAAPSDVYALAQDVANWPRILPHYNYVRVLRETHDARVAVMSARRNWIPVRWTAEQHLLPAIPRIEFTHIAGWAKGMRVAWIFDPLPHGTRVIISHDLAALQLPLVRTRLGQQIISEQFIVPIASRTLASVKKAAESRRG
jgi:ribosome-associated toxin RatA of RatAB toxin-antitoxin module